MARWLQKLLQNGHASVVYYVVLYDVVLQYNLEVECGLCGWLYLIENLGEQALYDLDCMRWFMCVSLYVLYPKASSEWMIPYSI